MASTCNLATLETEFWKSVDFTGRITYLNILRSKKGIFVHILMIWNTKEQWETSMVILKTSKLHFDLIHHRCRGDRLKKSEKEHYTLREATEFLKILLFFWRSKHVNQKRKPGRSGRLLRKWFNQRRLKKRRTHSYIKHYIKVWRLLFDACLSHEEREYLPNIKVNFVLFSKQSCGQGKVKKVRYSVR